MQSTNHNMAPYHTSPYLKFGGVLVALLLGAGYFAFQARGVLAGPALVVATPINGGTVAEEMVTIAGTAPAATLLTLNDRPIFTDPEGRFTEDILLAKGYNVITVSARDRFGRETEETLELIYK